MKRRIQRYEGWTELSSNEQSAICVNCNGVCRYEITSFRQETKPPSDELEEHVLESFLCEHCGYTSNSELKVESDVLEKAINSSPKLVVDLGKLDTHRNIMWFPSVVNVPGVGIIYPEGTIKTWEWVVTPAIALSESERGKFGMVDYSHRLAIEQSKRFKQTEFKLALNELTLLSKLNSNEPLATA